MIVRSQNASWAEADEHMIDITFPPRTHRLSNSLFLDLTIQWLYNIGGDGAEVTLYHDIGECIGTCHVWCEGVTRRELIY